MMLNDLDRPKTRLYLVQIAVKVKGDKAIVRKTTFHGNRKVAGRYGLAVNGEWVWTREGEPYPDECILPVEVYEDA